MIRILALFLAFPAHAESISISGSILTIQPGDAPQVRYVLTFENKLVNGPNDERQFTLDADGDPVALQFDWDVREAGGADAVTVTPPPGTYCEPVSCILEVPEMGTGALFLMEWVGG